jgi:hypothetical protein
VLSRFRQEHPDYVPTYTPAELDNLVIAD